MSPTIKVVTFGTTHCIMWANLTGYYAGEVACYTDNLVGQVQAQPAGRTMVGDYPVPDDELTSIAWKLRKDGTAEFGVNVPAGIPSSPTLTHSWTFAWTFPAP